MASQQQDILSLIQADHRKVEKLFQEAEKADSNSLYQLFNQIYMELNLHTRGEELSLYPAMREYQETEKFLAEAEKEHKSAETLLERLRQMQPDSPAFMELLGELKQAVQHHVREEENDIFQAVHQCMTEDQLMELGQQFQTAKTKAQADVKEAISR